MKFFRQTIGVAVVLCGLSFGGSAWASTAADYNNAGIQAYGQGQWREAITNFEKAYEIEPQHETVRHNLCNAHQAAANALAKEADFSAAVKHLELAIGIDPANAAPLVQLGAYYLRLDMVPEAVLRLEEAIELAPGQLDAHEFLGQAYYLDNDLPSARAQWEYVLEMEPNRPGLKERYEKAFREEGVEGDFKRGKSRHFTISYPEDVPAHLRSLVLNLLERAYLDVGRKTGGVYPPGPMQVIVYKEEQFSEATLLESHVGAVYDGKIRVPLTEKGEFLPEEELRRRLTHEYVHVVVRYAGGPEVPWWMNEGLAEVLSRDFSQDAQAMLRRAHQAQLNFSLGDLEGSQLHVLKPDVLRLAYAQSQATVDLMWNRFGQRRFMQMLTDIAAGVDPEEALRRNYRRTYTTLEQEVAAGYL